MDVVPLAAKEYNSKLYIVLKGRLGANQVTGIGIYSGNVEKFEDNKFDFLYNLYDIGNDDPKSFITENLKLSDEITLELQEAVDSSVNLIINDPASGIYLINSGEGDRLGFLIGKYIDDSTLARQLSLTKNITTLGHCAFKGVNEGGRLPVGTYFFYFKYIDGLDNESSIFTSEGPIMLCIGSPLRGVESIRGGLGEENSNKSINLLLTDLDTNFDSVAIYYSKETSDLQESISTSYKKITNPFKYTGNNLEVHITGLEETTDITYDQLNYTKFDLQSCKTIAQSNGYLFGANLSNVDKKSSVLREVASKIKLEEIRDPVNNIGNNPLYSTVNDFSYIILEIEDEMSYISKMKKAMVDNDTVGVMFVLKKDLNFNTVQKEYEEFLVAIENCKFQGILFGAGFSMTIETESFYGALFPSCEKAVIRDLKLNISLNSLKTQIFNAKLLFARPIRVEWEADINNTLNSKSRGVVLSKSFNSSRLLRCDINVNIYTPKVLYRSNFNVSKYTGELIDGYTYVRDSVDFNLYINSSVSTVNDCILEYNIVNQSTTATVNNGVVCSFFYHLLPETSELNNVVLHRVYCDSPEATEYNQRNHKLFFKIIPNAGRTAYSNLFIGKFYVITDNLPNNIELKIIDYDFVNPGRVPFVSRLSNVGTFEHYSTVKDSSEIKKRYVKQPKVDTYYTSLDYWETLSVEDASRFLLSSDVKYITDETTEYITTPKIDYIFETPSLDIPDDRFEYANPINITNRLGYWADEYYRFGIQFIDILGNRSDVFDIIGSVDDIRNNYGVYKTSKRSPITAAGVIPIGFKPIIQDYDSKYLKSIGILGYSIVRQQRLPTIFCQGLAISRLRESGLPFLGRVEGLQQDSRNLKRLYTGINSNAISVDSASKYSLGGIISPDINLNSEYYSDLFTGSAVNLTAIPNNIKRFITPDTLEQRLSVADEIEDMPEYTEKFSVLYIPENCRGINYKNKVFRTIAGDADLNYSYEFITKNTADYDTVFLRGEYSSFLGVVESSALDTPINKLFNVEIKKDPNDELKIRSQDNNAYYQISQPIYLDSEPPTCFKGDCFVGNYYQRINKNFITAEAPFQDGVVNAELKYPEGSVPNSAGYGRPQDFKDINLADLNAVRLGQWVGFKCCSNVNHIYRTLDVTRPSERALFSKSGEGGVFAGARGFYPYYEATSAPYNKLLDSTTMNSGYNRTLSRLASFSIPEKYSLKKEFPTRVVFSRRHFGSSLVNNYRIFDLLSYRDYPTNMGAITKIVDFQGNLLIVFERGIGLAPIQERVAVGDGDGGNLFINSSQVLPDRLKILSDKYGSTHPTSIIRTPFGVYGVDIEQRKIWRTNGANFELISDFTIQKLLNETFEKISEKSCNFNNSIVAFTHPYKNDVYFSFNLRELKDANEDFSITYSEMANCWSSRTKWTVPLTVNYRNNLLTFRKDRSDESTGTYKVWEHGLIKNANRLPGQFFYKTDNTEIEFIVGADSVNSQKIFENLKLISNNCFPASITYSITQGAYNPEEAEIEVSTTQTPLDMRKHGRVRGTAMYKENLLDVTIKALPPKIQFPGWSGNSNVANTRRAAKLRDKYMRIKLIYDNSEVITLHSAITLFTESAS